nr:homeobox protein MSX-1-like [Procambarus clarkii]
MGGSGGYLSLPPMLSAIHTSQLAALPRLPQARHTPITTQSSGDSMPGMTQGRDQTSPHLPLQRPHHPRMRRSFTIADLLGAGDDQLEGAGSPLAGALEDAGSPLAGALDGAGSPLTGALDGVALGQGPSPRLYDDQRDTVSPQEDTMDGCHGPADPGSRFEWLQCTRYHPPKLPRVKRREGGQKRKLGRNPRVPFSSTQLAALEARFRQSQYLSSCDVADLSLLLNLTETRVKIWFQNRRARERRDREARVKGLVPPSSSSSSSSSPSSSTGGPLPPSALALYQFTAALAPGSASAFTPVMPRPFDDAPPTQMLGSSHAPPTQMLGSSHAPPTQLLGSSHAPPTQMLGSSHAPPTQVLGSSHAPPTQMLGSSHAPPTQLLGSSHAPPTQMLGSSHAPPTQVLGSAHAPPKTTTPPGVDTPVVGVTGGLSPRPRDPIPPRLPPSSPQAASP